MTLELKRPLIYFDLETTGTDPQRDRIIELAAVKIWPDGNREEKCRRFNPQMSIPKEATAVHGITDQDVRDEPPFAKVAKGDMGIAAYFAGCDLAGYNVINFDLPMLMAELERAGERLGISRVAVVDAFRIFVSREPRDLTGALRFYCGREHAGAHSALADVEATIEVLEAQLNRYRDLPSTPADLDAAVRDPEEVDRQGKLKWVDGEIALAFGRHKSKTLRFLAREEPDYIRWMIDNRVTADAVHHLHDALLGHFATKDEDEPAESGDEEEA
ncbi:MAG: 3'-5' exonuclease [Deltaproteobacteria bacterium]|nr:3'-5' exonuclease [Deltaproteobacteria bacterium]